MTDKNKELIIDEAPCKETYNTLKEPVLRSFSRDFKKIYKKIFFLFDLKNKDILENKREIISYDLWGPFIFFLVFSISLSVYHLKDIEIIFSTLFFVLILGSVIITINSKLLNVNISFFQGISILGYSLFPLSLLSIFLVFLPIIVKDILLLISLVISLMICFKQINILAEENKKLLVKYPILLFYFLLSFFILIN